MIDEIEKSKKNLDRFLSANDMSGFRVEVHGIKGALATIGARELSEKALELEKASGNNNDDFCTAHLPALLEELDRLSKGIKEVFSQAV